MKRKLLSLLLAACLLFAGCKEKFSPIPPAREIPRPESAPKGVPVDEDFQKSGDSENQESSAQSTPPASVTESQWQFPAEYLEIALPEDIWDGQGLFYQCLGAHNGLMIFYARTDTYYHFCSIRAADSQVLYRKSIPRYDVEISLQQGILFLKTRTEVTALDSTLTEIYREPVPETVRTMLENATLGPENHAGFRLPDMYLSYDISANFVYAFADDYGMYLYNAKSGQLTRYITFEEPYERLENVFYYPDHFWRPQYSRDGLVLEAQGISLPTWGGVHSFVFRVHLENGEVERLLTSDLFDERNAQPHYPLVHMGNLSAEQGLYRYEYSQGNRMYYRYFVGPAYTGITFG